MTSQAISHEISTDLDKRRRQITAGFARFYSPLAVLTFVLTFFPYYKSDPGESTQYGSLWQEATRTGHSYDIMAVIIFLAIVALLTLAAVEVLGVVGLVATAVLTLSIGTLLWTAPGFSDPPEHSHAGILDITICLIGTAILLSNAACLLVLARVQKRRTASATAADSSTR
ncbi:hypothetical protein SAMN04489751_2740 [Brevibacterium sandarakinum]|uniref:SPW repeat-containing protein n=1 Tax=Brevibacterium sandarakinum TaxID=629680 RepID=A0A1H1UNX4_BRESA|nr:hypothetical protein [Brevibacterium sandarakinum]SDS74197.1 hypothetical protein SAMN04489751_2740 [Brevibacterium sandarakinum]